MDVKTFEAFSMKDAVKSVKRTLGADAVILSTREKPAPGGKGTLYEVTAAAASNSRKVGASSGPSTSAGGSSQTPLWEGISALLSSLAEQTPTRSQVQALEAGMQELKLLLIEALRTKEGSTIEGLAAPLVVIDRQLRVMGVSDVSIAELMKHLRTIPAPAASSGENVEDYYRDQAIRWMMKRIKIAPRWTIMRFTAESTGNS